MTQRTIFDKTAYQFYAAIVISLMLFLLIFGALRHLPLWGVYFVGLNLITFALYGFDKRIAGSTWPRVPENLLHTLALLGGSPAALMAQRFFRHKTFKKKFLLVYWLIVVAQIALLAWMAW